MYAANLYAEAPSQFTLLSSLLLQVLDRVQGMEGSFWDLFPVLW